MITRGSRAHTHPGAERLKIKLRACFRMSSACLQRRTPRSARPPVVVEDLVPDSLWERVAPLLPNRPPRRQRFPGHKPVDDRVALAGIVFVVKTGITWNELPAAAVGCSGVTCWRRVRDWTRPGCGRRCTNYCWPSSAPPGCSTWTGCGRRLARARAQRGDHVGPSPVNRGHPGSKHHLIVDAHGIPLAVTVTGGNRHDVTQLLPLLDAVPPDPRPARAAAPQAPRAVRRPRLRLRQVPPSAPRARHQPAHRPPRRRATAPAWARSAGSSNAACAPRGALLYPRFSREELGGRFLGLNGLPGCRKVKGTRACQETSGRVQGSGTACWGTRVIWRKLDCLKPNLQTMQVPIRRKDV